MAHYKSSKEFDKNEAKKAYAHTAKHSPAFKKAASKALKKKMEDNQQYDSLAHLKDPKTGKYDLKLHSRNRNK